MAQGETAAKPPAPVPGDEITRVRLGASPNSAPGLLAALATDPAITVRAAVALNTAAPADVDHLLAHDGDDRVRNLLARRLAVIVASAQLPERAGLRQHAVEVVGTLAKDKSVRVRTSLAEAVKETPHAPHDLILQLAHDHAVPVSEPVIRLSPVLTPDDLLALLAAAPNYVAGAAVAARIGLNETLCNAVANGTDAAAISALLANHSAAIPKETLNALAARAAGRPDWQELMLQRPDLSASPSEILGGRKQVRAPTVDEAMWEARELANRGALDEDALLAAVQRGEARMATALLAVAADVPLAVVDRAATMHNAKALVSLVWHAGFSMRVTGPVQILLARTPPAQVLRAGPNGAFPLAKEDMCWQITLLKSMVR